jgi:hypothetical protein
MVATLCEIAGSAAIGRALFLVRPELAWAWFGLVLFAASYVLQRPENVEDDSDSEAAIASSGREQ